MDTGTTSQCLGVSMDVRDMEQGVVARGPAGVKLRGWGRQDGPSWWENVNESLGTRMAIPILPGNSLFSSNLDENISIFKITPLKGTVMHVWRIFHLLVHVPKSYNIWC